VIDQEQTVNPCTSQSGMLTLTATNAVEHVTYNANGFWSTFTAEGTATFAPDNGADQRPLHRLGRRERPASRTAPAFHDPPRRLMRDIPRA
jgi:hypothetical protein